MAALTDDDKEDVLLAGRYGDLDDIQQFVAKFGAEPLADIRDDNENCILHMVCGNGHLDVLDYLLPLVPPSLLAAQNSARSTPLHWAALNGHLAVMQKLVEFPGGPGIDLIDAKNAAGRSPLGEAELAGWDEGAAWLVKMMNLDTEVGEKEKNGDAEEEADIDGPLAQQDIEVEIEDAEGQVAKMTISGGHGARSS
ncbi:Ankyrin repeat-containing protein P16F5.05c [Hypsizygus marmoreus]|uniref:Ankyrin repeat-containing protein P16F5.05c n=1 Tax=Hypsizygus marmoreus TaxID=39966 RepID=A0A369JZS8_HYPMA|nr:Ankyrin repeat-containing protein P16F5.05c [Hypsizygus marmoreus]